MATNVKKAKKKPVKKTYDTNIVKYVAIIASAVVVALVACALVIHFATNYVAKVDGAKIFNYEYEYFAQDALAEVYEQFEFDENNEEGIKKADAEAAFWTDEKRQEAKDLALEKAVEYKTGYLLAKKQGFKLTNEQKRNVKDNVDYYINYTYSFYQQYQSYFGPRTYEQVLQEICGTLSVRDFKKVNVNQSTTELYRTSLKDKYSATDDELRAIYDEDPDAYRTISARVLRLNLPEAPTSGAVKPTAPKRADGTEVKAEDPDAGDFQKELDEYKTAMETYEKSLEEYNKKYDEYKENKKKIEDRANEIAKALNETGKYSEVKKDAEGNAEKDADGNEVYVYKDADFITLIKSESSLYDPDDEESAADPGLVKETADNKIGVADVDDLIFSYQWTADRTGIGVVEKVKEEEKEESEDEEKTEDAEQAEDAAEEEKKEPVKYVAESGTKPSEIKVISSGSYVFLVRCEDITDFENSVDSSEDAKDSIKETIKAKLFDDKATEELNGIVDEAIKNGDDYTATNKKDKKMKEIIEKLLNI